MIDVFVQTITDLWQESGLAAMQWQNWVMIAISFVLVYLAIVKGFEPLLLLPIAFGMFLTNLPMTEMFHMDYFVKQGNRFWTSHAKRRLARLPVSGREAWNLSVFDLPWDRRDDRLRPADCKPEELFARRRCTARHLCNICRCGYAGLFSGICGCDRHNRRRRRPTAIYVAKSLAPTILGSIAVAAYSYMALVPLIQPPIMKLLTTKKERMVVMKQLRPVSKTEKIVFPIAVTLIVSLIVPSAAPLLGMLMLGNLMKESGMVDRLVKTAQNELMNIVTIFLGVTVGATATADYFLTPQTLKIIVLGLIAFGFGTAGGVLFGKLMYIFTKGKVNPLIGSAGVSAVPMAAVFPSA